MKLHILTLTWNGLDCLNELYPGLINNLSNSGIESTWYIRDNGSKDDTVKVVNSWNNLDIKIFEIGHNKDNFSQGVNYLFEKASPKDEDLILLLNNDVIFNDNKSLNNMIKLMSNNIGVVGARLLYPGTNTLQHAGVTFSKRYNSLPFHFRPGQVSDELAEKNRYFQCVTAAVCLIKAKDFKDANGLNAQFSWSFDDIDLMLRIGLNKKIVYCGKTNITHMESRSLKLNPVNKLFMNNNVNLFRKLWNGKYILDDDLYIENPHYNELQ